MAENKKESRISFDNFDFAHEGATNDAPMLINFIVSKIRQAMGNTVLQAEVQDQLQAINMLPLFQPEGISMRAPGESSKEKFLWEKVSKVIMHPKSKEARNCPIKMTGILLRRGYL